MSRFFEGGDKSNMKKYKFVNGAVVILLSVCCLAPKTAAASVAEYQTPDTSLEESSMECVVIYKGTYDFSETIPKYPELDVSGSGYEGTYDGNPHGIIVDCKTDGADILYSPDGKTYTEKKPVYTDAGTYVTFYRVEKEGYSAATGSFTVRINEAAIDFDADDSLVFYDGKSHGIDLSVQTEGCRILYSKDGINFSSRKSEYKEPGTYVVYYKIFRENYAAVTGSSKVTILEKDNAANSNNQDNNSVKQNTGQNTNVQTGDGSHILLYGVMLAASGTGLLKNRRKEKKDS